MKKSLRYREVLADVRRVVVKIGSRVLVQKSGRPVVRRMRVLTRELARLHRDGRELAIVTSGAVGAGMEALGMSNRPSGLPDLQMAAAVGQLRLMTRYDALFSDRGCKVGQVLLTHHDFQHKIRLTNARRTMENLMRHDVIPIINENDVVADEEIRADLALGDNDFLASLVVKLIRADLLVMLTTVDGVRGRDASGRSRRMPYIEAISKKTYQHVTAHDEGISKGGMATKLKAAHDVSRTGCSVVIANGRQADVVTRIMNCEDVGTLILASGL